MTLGPDTQLGHYRILRSLGSGGMADVFEAQDTMLDRVVALKVLPIEYSRNPQLVARFQKEVRAAAKLNHRNIVTVFEVGQEGAYHFFSMRLLTGGDLRKRIQRGLSPVEALAVLRELADAFSHAHARGFVHRDVKPENVMFDEQGFPVLTDFGIAKALDANTHMTRTGMTMGTPRYLSPEQASGKPVDARADLYSLGVMFYEMLTGRPPYDAEESMAVIFKHVTEPVPVLDGDRIRFQPLLNKLMAKDPSQRFSSADELIRAIDALSHGGDERPLPSQVRTAENPLLKALLTPSPLRTAPPTTPAPLTPRPLVTPDSATLPSIHAPSGEVAVATPPVLSTRDLLARRPPPASPARAPAARPSSASEAPPPAAAAAPRRRVPGLIGGVAAGAAALAVLAWALLSDRSAPTASGAVAPPPATEAPAPDAAAQAREAERPAQNAKQRAETEARRKAESEAAARRQREQAAEQARKTQLREEQEAAAAREARARQEARDRAEAQRRAEADAAERAEAQRKAEAEAAARHRREEAAEQARLEKQRQEDAARKAAEAKKKEEGQQTREERERAAEEAAKERARRPMGF